MVNLDNKPFEYTLAQAKNTTAKGLRNSVMYLSHDRLELWETANTLKTERDLLRVKSDNLENDLKAVLLKLYQLESKQ